MGGAIREPAAAGRLYPDEPAELAGMVDGLIDLTPAPTDSEPGAAYIVPHAGYRYSGRTASYVYAHLREVAPKVRRVVMLGPAHFDPLLGCAVPATESWLTPLGPVPIDVEGCAALAKAATVRMDDAPHRREHSLEVQLPFLQRCVGPDVPVLPIVVGPAGAEEISDIIQAGVAHSPVGTVVLCSTDLSHYLDPATALVKDAQTVQAILDVSPEKIVERDVCGIFALRGLLGWARREQLSPALLHLSTVRTGDSDRAVGYTAIELSSL